MKKIVQIITLLSLTCACLVVNAENIPLQTQYPERYVVVKGDTLWRIAGKFLKNPWQWPALWGMNKAEIKNPHHIYPGDVVAIDMVNGRPKLKLLSQQVVSQTVNLEPGVIVTPLNEHAIATIQPNIITPFITKPQVMEANDIKKAPRIVAGQEQRYVLSPGTRIYVQDLPAGDTKPYWSIYRTGEEIKDPKTKAVLGYESKYLGEAKILQAGNPAVAVITKAVEEIFVKDRLLPTPDDLQQAYVPRAPEADVQAQIVKISSGVAETGVGSVVLINKGAKDGLEQGHVLAIQRHGELIDDPEPETKPDAKIQLPTERAGLLMVFKTFERLSYGLIMESNGPVYALDTLTSPKP
jgi:LysM domain